MKGDSSSIGVAAQQATDDGPGYDFEIEGHAPVSHVVQIVLDSLRNGGVAAPQAVYLRPPGNTTLNVVPRHI